MNNNNTTSNYNATSNYNNNITSHFNTTGYNITSNNDTTKDCSCSKNSNKSMFTASFMEVKRVSVGNDRNSDDRTISFQRDAFKPQFYTCTMVGDNFFLNLAVFSMGYRMNERNKVLQSGFCVSGQTIDQATDLVAKMSPNQIILVNIGSVDIMKGKQTIELIVSLVRFMTTCKNNSITPILTTLLPIANYRVPATRVKILNEYNELIMQNPFNFPVIALHEAFNKSDGKMSENYYQSVTRFASGFKKPIVFWSTSGRERIMNLLKQEIGSAILKVLLQ
jgi:maternal effect protein oskar